MTESKKTFIALLRGINVSGHNMIKMDALKQLFSDLGFSNIQTYLQSGNVVFNSEEIHEDKLRETIESSILKQFGLIVPVIILEKDRLISVRNSCPFISENQDPSAIYITFLHEKIDQNSFSSILLPKITGEEALAGEKAIYLYLPAGYGKTKLNNNFFENKLKTVATTRNWKTVNELLILAD